jgi:hypothetical protein
MTMLRDRRLAPHPTSTPITAQVIHVQPLNVTAVAAIPLPAAYNLVLRWT